MSYHIRRNIGQGFIGGDMTKSDTTAPTVVITIDEADPTIANPITFRATCSEAAVGFSADAFTIANGTKVTYTAVSPTVFTQTVTPGAGLTVSCDVAAGAFTDAALNDNTAASQVTVETKIIVWDTFTDTETTLNATSATPGPGTRVETDTNGKISTNGSDLVFITGAAANDAIWWDAVTRGYGAVAVWAVTPSEVTTGIPVVGWDSAASGAILDALQFGESSALKVVPNGGTAVTVGTYTAAAHYVAAVMKATGIYWFIKGGNFTNWTYLYSTAAGTGNGYPAVSAGNTTSIFTVPFMRAFKAGTYDVPLIAYDTFTQDDGAPGNSDTTGPDNQTVTARAWTSPNGVISTNKLVITPTLGAEMWDAAASVFTSGTYGWVPFGNNTIANDANSLQITYVDNTAGAKVQLRDSADLNSDLTIGTFYKLSYDSKVGSTLVIPEMTGMYSATCREDQAGFTSRYMINQASATQTNAFQMANMSGVETINIDNISLKPITLSTCLATLTDTATASVVASADFTNANTYYNPAPRGFILNLDSAASPANYILAYHAAVEGAIHYVLVYCIAGTTTKLIGTSSGTPYSAGKPWVVATEVSGTNILVRMFYNGVAQGAVQTVPDAGNALRGNTIHGLFSASSDTTITNFDLRARSEYTGLDALIA